MINDLNQKFNDSQKSLKEKMDALLTLQLPMKRRTRRETSLAIEQENSSISDLNRTDGKQKQKHKESTTGVVENATGGSKSSPPQEGNLIPIQILW